MQKAQVSIASTGYDDNPYNMHFNGLTGEVKIECKIAGLVGLGFNTIGVSDGISMGPSGMYYPLARHITCTLASFRKACLILFYICNAI